MISPDVEVRPAMLLFPAAARMKRGFMRLLGVPGFPMIGASEDADPNGYWREIIPWKK